MAAASDDDAACIIRSYGDMATAHAGISQTQRRELDNAPVRLVNNFVKACAIDAAVRAAMCSSTTAAATLDVLEVGGGRGQDHAKWRHACTGAAVRLCSFVGIDLCAANTAGAQDMARRQLPATTASAFYTLDAGDPAVAWPVASASVDVVSIQLALHYFCDSEARMVHVLSEAARCVRASGLVLTSFTDARAVVRLAREAVAAQSGGGADATVRVPTRFCTLDVPVEHLAPRLPSIWGRRYVFEMPGSVCAPEYLCHEGAIAKCVLPKLRPEVPRLLCGPSIAFDAAIAQWRRRPRLEAIARLMVRDTPVSTWLHGADPDTLAAACLYRLALYAPGAHVLGAWTAALAA